VNSSAQGHGVMRNHMTRSITTRLLLLDTCRAPAAVARGRSNISPAVGAISRPALWRGGRENTVTGGDQPDRIGRTCSKHLGVGIEVRRAGRGAPPSLNESAFFLFLSRRQTHPCDGGHRDPRPSQVSRCRTLFNLLGPL